MTKMIGIDFLAIHEVMFKDNFAVLTQQNSFFYCVVALQYKVGFLNVKLDLTAFFLYFKVTYFVRLM